VLRRDPLSFSIGLGFALLALVACGCREGSAARKPAFSKGVVGVWVVRMEPTLQRVTAVPHELSHQFADLAAYQASIREKLEGLQFEFYPDNKVFLRFAQGKSPFADGSTIWSFNWERGEDGSYRLVEPGPHIPLLSKSVSHRFEVSGHDSGICHYQMQWSENSAPRSPLVVEKIWE